MAKKMFDKIKKLFDDDDLEEYEEVEQRQKPQQQRIVQEVQQMPTNYQKPQQVKQMPVQRKKNVEAERQKPFVEQSHTPNLVSITQKSSKVVLYEPRVYSEAQDIADSLRNKRAVVVNLQSIDKQNGKKIIDFISGAIFVLNGDMTKIGADTFLCTPENMEVDGSINLHDY